MNYKMYISYESIVFVDDIVRKLILLRCQINYAIISKDDIGYEIYKIITDAYATTLVMGEYAGR